MGNGACLAKKAIHVRACQPLMQRSEEHTSELQSQSNLVCRLLLEKKKKSNCSKYVGDADRGNRWRVLRQRGFVLLEALSMVSGFQVRLHAWRPMSVPTHARLFAHA